MYIRVQLMRQIMKLNVFRWTNILLQYSMVKNDRFGLHFCFPWRRPCDYSAKCHINRKTIECLQMSRSTYPSICNSFPVIRTTSAKKYPFSRTAAHIFVFLQRRLCDYNPIFPMDEKRVGCLPNPSQRVRISIVSELYNV